MTRLHNLLSFAILAGSLLPYGTASAQPNGPAQYLGLTDTTTHVIERYDPSTGVIHRFLRVEVDDRRIAGATVADAIWSQSHVPGVGRAPGGWECVQFAGSGSTGPCVLVRANMDANTGEIIDPGVFYPTYGQLPTLRADSITEPYAHAWQSQDSGQILVTVADEYGGPSGRSTFYDLFFPARSGYPYLDPYYALQRTGETYLSCALEDYTYNEAPVTVWESDWGFYGPATVGMPFSRVALDRSVYYPGPDIWTRPSSGMVGTGQHHRCGATPFVNADLEAVHDHF